MRRKGEMETFWLEEGPDEDESGAGSARKRSGFKNKLKNMFNGN